MIEINGSVYEGGGQILRTAISLSVVTQKPCRVFNIRKKRPNPGLAHQHLLTLKALGQLCNGKLEGVFLGSQEIKFYPGSIFQNQISINIPTAGSITLILQALIPPGLSSPNPIVISFDGGATDTFFSPTLDYFQYIFLRILEKMGVKAEIKVIKRGFYPEGGAKLEIKILPSLIKPISLIERGTLKKVSIISGASENLKKKRVAERQISGAKQILGKLKLPLEEKVTYHHTLGTGSYINIVGELENTVLGADNLGKLGKSAETVGQEAAEKFLREAKSKACLDKHLADQILPYMALAKGKSEIMVSEITNHCRANIWVIEKFARYRNEIPNTKFLNGKFRLKDNLIIWNPS